MKLSGRLTISRTNCSNGEDYITVSIDDNASRIEFVSFEISLENFAKALTSQAMMEGEFEIHGIDMVGKKLCLDKMEFEMPECDYKERKDKAYETAKSIVQKGWEVDNYFNSQDSFFLKDGKSMARATVRRYA